MLFLPSHKLFRKRKNFKVQYDTALYSTSEMKIMSRAYRKKKHMQMLENDAQPTLYFLIDMSTNDFQILDFVSLHDQTYSLKYRILFYNKSPTSFTIPF